MERWSARIDPAQVDDTTLFDLLNVLVRMNVRWLQTHPETPSLYSSGVWYQVDEPTCSAENWLSIPKIMEQARHGRGVDCKSIAAWRAAELIAMGEQAQVSLTKQREGQNDYYHVVVRRGNGSIEDPSRVLGMGA